jgi:predicted secreted protein
MAYTSAFVLFAVTWFMVMFVVLPLRLRTQADEGEVVPGTHASAPASFNLKRKMWIAVLFAIPIWGLLMYVILSDMISVRDFDWFKVLDSQ